MVGCALVRRDFERYHIMYVRHLSIVIAGKTGPFVLGLAPSYVAEANDPPRPPSDPAGCRLSRETVPAVLWWPCRFLPRKTLCSDRLSTASVLATTTNLVLAMSSFVLHTTGETPGRRPEASGGRTRISCRRPCLYDAARRKLGFAAIGQHQADVRPRRFIPFGSART